MFLVKQNKRGDLTLRPSLSRRELSSDVSAGWAEPLQTASASLSNPDAKILTFSEIEGPTDKLAEKKNTPRLCIRGLQTTY